MNRIEAFRGIFLVLILTIISGCATNPVTGRSDIVLMSESQEIELGRKHHRQVLQQYPVYNDKELQNYVSALGQRLADASHRSHLDFSFTVLDSPEVNAFALPGGYIYITRGIMSYMNSEEELAGVLGHEIGHVTARHSVRQQTAQTGAGLVSMGVAILTGRRAAAQAIGQAASALTSGYGRSHELEADRLGAEYLARIGYDPEQMLGVIGILKDQEEFEIQRAKEENRRPRNYHGVYSTHPRNDQRLQTVIKAAEQYKNPDAEVTNPEDFLRLMDGVTFGNSEEQGILRDSRFYHKSLDFTLALPRGWQIDNQPSQLVTIKPGRGAAMILQLEKLQGNESAAQFMRRKFRNIQQGQNLSGNRFTAVVRGQTPFGDNRPIRVGTIVHDGRAFVLSAFSKNRIPDTEFFDTLDSFRRLDRDERKLATAKKLKIYRVRGGDSMSRLASRLKLGKYGEEQLRLINGLYPDGEPENGQLIKIIR
ncbi:MAG: M48 family metalloprotease [Pseudomonadota bacterium]